METVRGVWRACCLIVLAVSAGCTTSIGTPNPELLRAMSAAGEFGTQQSVRLCGLLDAGVSEAAARTLIDEAWNRTEAALLGLRMEIASVRALQREGGDMGNIFSNIRKLPVAPECDRVLAFIGTSREVVSDLAGGVSLTHGFVLTEPESTSRFGFTPVETVRHELYHLVGCGHASTMDECYRRIARAKARRGGAGGFFPVFTYVLEEDIAKNCGENPLIEDRAEANRIAQAWAVRTEQAASGRASPRRRCDA